MRRALIVSLFLAVSVGVAGTANAEIVQYMSRHPLPKRVGHGFCDIDVPHFHDYPPSDPRLYRQMNGAYYFVGDPTPFDYDGPRYGYYGPHPIVDASVQMGGPAYCYIRGPHYHWYAPGPNGAFDMRGGVYWYTGTYDPVFYAQEPQFVVVNDYYAPLVYSRPVVDVQMAPPAFHGELVVGGGPGGWRTVREGPEWRRGPEFRGPDHLDRREVVMRERHDEAVRREQEHRGWDHDRHGGPEQRGWHGGPERGPEQRGWHGGPERGAEQRGFHGGPPAEQRGWHAGPAAPQRGQDRGGGWRGPPANSGGWHGGGAPPGGGPHPGAPQRNNNGFHR